MILYHLHKRLVCNSQVLESFLWTTKAMFVETFAGLQYDKYTIDHVTFLIPVHVTRVKQASVKTTIDVVVVFHCILYLLQWQLIWWQKSSFNHCLSSHLVSKIHIYVTTGALLNYFIRLKEEYVYILNVYILKYLLSVLMTII